MSVLTQIQDGFHRWIDSVAGTVNGMLDRLRSKRDVQVIEDDSDTFILHVEGADAAAPGRSAKKNPSLPDHRFRIANGAVEGALPADWATMLRASHAELIIRPARLLFP